MNLNTIRSEQICQRGQELEDNGQIDEAIALFSQAILTDPTNDTPYTWRGYCKMTHLKNYRGAVEDFTIAIRNIAANWERTKQIGMMRGDDTAKKIYSDVLLYRAECYENLREYENGLGDLEKAGEINYIPYGEKVSDFSSLMLEKILKRVSKYLIQRKIDEMIKDLTFVEKVTIKGSLKLDTNNRINYTHLKSLAMIHSKQYREGIETLTVGIPIVRASNPKSRFLSVFHHNRGLCYWLMEENQNAIKDFKEAIKLSPNYFIAYESLGRAYVQTGRSEEGIEVLNKGLELNKSNTAMLYERAMGYYALGKYDDATVDIKKAIDLEPSETTYKEFLDKIEEAKTKGWERGPLMTTHHPLKIMARLMNDLGGNVDMSKFNNEDPKINSYRYKEKDVCTYCKKIPEEKLKQCSRCKNAYYCDPECQKKHWPDHKKICKPKQ